MTAPLAGHPYGGSAGSLENVVVVRLSGAIVLVTADVNGTSRSVKSRLMLVSARYRLYIVCSVQNVPLVSVQKRSTGCPVPGSMLPVIDALVHVDVDGVATVQFPKPTF